MLNSFKVVSENSVLFFFRIYPKIQKSARDDIRRAQE